MGVLGMTCGSLVSDRFIVNGRRKAILILNTGVIASCIPCLVMNIYAICIGRFLFGFFAGSCVNVAAISLVETIPKG